MLGSDGGRLEMLLDCGGVKERWRERGGEPFIYP